MTLILTRVATDGIVMAADTTLTETFGERTRFLEGAKKLFVHGPSSTCIGIWGGATTRRKDVKTPVALEFVIQEFIELAAHIKGGRDLAVKLADWLGQNAATTDAFVGIDVATVRPSPGEPMPAVYRLQNADSPDGVASQFFQVRTLRKPGVYDAGTDQYILPAGDRNGGIWVERFRVAALLACEDVGRPPPPDDVLGVYEWLPPLVRVVSETYRTLDIGRRIGSNVSRVMLRSGDGVVFGPTPS